MNKIKAKITTQQQFSPWEQSFRDLYNTLQMSKRKQAQYRLSSIQPKQNSLETSQKYPSKQMLNRTVLNMSKVNLHSDKQQPTQIVFSRSRRYQGPRVSFYAKMNPRGNRSKSSIQIDQQLFKQTQLLTKQLTGRIVRDSSIKYLDIIEEDLPSSSKHGNGLQYILPNNLNIQQLQRVKSKKSEEQHSYLRRLKFIYNSRKH